MPAVPMTADEMTRLRKSGRWLVTCKRPQSLHANTFCRLLNHAKKHMELLDEAHRDHADGIEHTHPNRMTLWYNVAQLRAVGEVLGSDGIGRPFTTRGEQLAVLPFMEHGREFVDECVTRLINMFRDRHELEVTRHGAKSGYENELTEEQADPQLRRDYIAWTHEQFWGIPFMMEGVGPKQNCTFCGARSQPHRMLKACGGCKVAIYCDKRCQTMHRKEHKAECKAKAGEIKAEEA